MGTTARRSRFLGGCFCLAAVALMAYDGTAFFSPPASLPKNIDAELVGRFSTGVATAATMMPTAAFAEEEVPGAVLGVGMAAMGTVFAVVAGVVAATVAVQLSEQN